MNVFLLDAGAPASCQPLTCTRALGAIPVGNQPLADVLAGRLIDAGHTPVVAAGPGVCCVRGDAWLSASALRRLADLPDAHGAALREQAGAPVAWMFASPPPDEAGPPGDDDCFLIRHPWDLLRVQERLLDGCRGARIEGQVSPAAHIEGTLWLGKGSRILPGVYLEGTVIIGDNCRIGPHCYLRGSTSIGNDCHVGQAVEIKNAILMQGVSIGHLSYCGDSIIGAGVNFGAGTITANLRHDGRNHRSAVGGEWLDTGRRKLGAILGDGVHTGIHTSIYPGRKLWPHVGTRPGDIVKSDRQA
jgi:bifunctional UDP-N-acetylglucosamine pyrophosphorylase/glucosamine-1-phosphate N-acetyltransferase